MMMIVKDSTNRKSLNECSWCAEESNVSVGDTRQLINLNKNFNNKLNNKNQNNNNNLHYHSSYLNGNNSEMKIMQSPYYLCTVTCCESENCSIIDPSLLSSTSPTSTSITTKTATATSNNMNKIMLNQYIYEPYKTMTTTPTTTMAKISSNHHRHHHHNHSINIDGTSKQQQHKQPMAISPLSIDGNNNNESINESCELCFQQSFTNHTNNNNENDNNSRIFWNQHNHNHNSDYNLSVNNINNNNNNSGSQNNNSNNNEESIFGRNHNKLKLKCLIPNIVPSNNSSPNNITNNNSNMIHGHGGFASPELSSSSPHGNNSSNTEFTELNSTPTLVFNNSNNSGNYHHQQQQSSSSIIQPLFKVNRENSSSTNQHQQQQPNSPTQLDYRLYFMNDAEKHGFFRKAVPTLPLAIAVLFCMMNLIIPGSGTLLASLAIIFGSQTEYGPGCGCQAFFICFLSAILQFITAIFVFGWVWSVMWGIVFIKNSLRYGQKRDIHTISLC